MKMMYISSGRMGKNIEIGPLQKIKLNSCIWLKCWQNLILIIIFFSNVNNTFSLAFIMSPFLFDRSKWASHFTFYKKKETHMLLLLFLNTSRRRVLSNGICFVEAFIMKEKNEFKKNTQIINIQSVYIY